MFRGNADLFSGLQIAESGYEFKKYPVIRLSMTTDSESPKFLKERLIKNLRNMPKPTSSISETMILAGRYNFLLKI
jgi:hypothetical protein